MSNDTPQSPSEHEGFGSADAERGTSGRADAVSRDSATATEADSTSDTTSIETESTPGTVPAEVPGEDVLSAAEEHDEPRRIDDVPTDVGEPEPAVEAPGLSPDAVSESEPAAADARPNTDSAYADSAYASDDVGDDTAAYDVIAVEYDEVDVQTPSDESQAAPAGGYATSSEAPIAAYGTAAAARTAAYAASAPQYAAPAPGYGAAPAPGYAAAGAAAAPVYVTAQTPPRNRGNRLMGILIAVVAAVAYAIVFAAVALGVFALREPRTSVDLWERYLPTAAFWVPVVVFFLAYALLIAIVNRGGWWAYVIGSFFVGVIVYFGYIGGALLTVQAWNLSFDAANQFIGTLWANPLTFGAAIVAREASLWFGAWIAARGRRVREANLEAQRDYDLRIAAGPATSSAG